MDFKTNKTTPTARKVRGGYYTPRALADYMCQWAIRTPSERVVEPSCGDGSFVSAAAAMLGEQGLITAVELVPKEIARAKESLRGAVAETDWHCASFFDVVPRLLQEPGYDVALGNPPFIRFQYFDRDERDRAFHLAGRFGYRPNGLANAWVTFVQLSAELLRDGGRLAMVVPAEILQVTYAAELRYRLPMLFDDVYIVAFDELVFPEIQQEVVLLLAEGRRRYSGTMGRLHTKQVANAEALTEDGTLIDTVSHLSERHTYDDMKWTSLFLEDCEFETLRAHDADPGLRRLGDLADVDVGIVTGRNRFFVIDDSQADELDTGSHTVDVVGRTSALKSIRFTKDDLLDYRASHPSNLLHLTGIDRRALSSQLETKKDLAHMRAAWQKLRARRHRRKHPRRQRPRTASGATPQQGARTLYGQRNAT